MIDSTHSGATMTPTRLENVTPIGRGDAEGLAVTETGRMVSLLQSLGADEWTRPTDCPAWDVRAMAGHVLGMTETFTGYRTMIRTMRAGGKAAGEGPTVDGLTAVQVEANAHLSTAELIDRLATAGPRQARWRARRRLLRPMPMKEQRRDGTTETWRMKYVLDVILTRDTWMHRVDISRATGRVMDLTSVHDGRIVADAAAEWARRHGQPCTLILTGTAGGTFTQGDGGEEHTLDAIEFCRILSGRATADGLLGEEVPF
jgi:uncharacterized protein (TIGR03083 family)